jgi:wyosine [tRNA(Phe)-imidazoG37] synthetase (radical SAM superfamily)
MAHPLCKGIYTEQLDYTSGYYTCSFGCGFCVRTTVSIYKMNDAHQHMIVPSAIVACNHASFTHVKDIVTAIL